MSAQAAQQLGLWWQFVVLSVLFYGVLPRWILWGVSKHQLRAHCRRVIDAHPEVDGIFRRLTDHRVSTRSLEPSEHGFNRDEENVSRYISEKVDSRDAGLYSLDKVGLINWSQLDCSDPEFIQCLFPSYEGSHPVAQAGGARSIDQDEALIRQLADGKYTQIVLALKSWEPPLAELSDFIEHLLNINFEQVLLLPLAARGQSLRETDIVEWSRFVKALNRSEVILLPGQMLPNREKE